MFFFYIYVNENPRGLPKIASWIKGKLTRSDNSNHSMTETDDEKQAIEYFESVESQNNSTNNDNDRHGEKLEDFPSKILDQCKTLIFQKPPNIVCRLPKMNNTHANSCFMAIGEYFVPKNRETSLTTRAGNEFITDWAKIVNETERLITSKLK